MTGLEIQGGDGIWDDGEWISWEWINTQLEDEPEEDIYSIEPAEPFRSREGFPFSVLGRTGPGVLFRSPQNGVRFTSLR